MATSKIAFDFNESKAIETILYLANRISRSYKYKICKMLYLADKTSLEKYGRFIFGESYSAMQEGATPSKSYDILKQIAEETGISDILNLPATKVFKIRAQFDV